jgi:hypothetical protein
VSVFFDVCATIGQDSRRCRGLAWERTYRLNDEYMCPEVGLIVLTGVVSHGLLGRK